MSKNQSLKHNNKELREKLYSIFLFVNNLYNLEDLSKLQSKDFLSLCEVQDIDWSFSPQWLKTKFTSKNKQSLWPFQYTSPLVFKTENYGDFNFYSSQKIKQSKKKFLQKVSSFVASTLYSIENKEKISNIKKQWENTFDSFCQAFCITNKNFNIIHSNQAFQQLFQTKKYLHKNLFEIFPFPVKEPKQTEKEGSFLAQGKKNNEKKYWDISFKTLYLQKENSKAMLFLIKDVTEEIKMESQISNQAKEQELGLIKGSLAHELNNPIAGIKALLSAIENSAPKDQNSIKESLKDMQKAMDTCHQVVQNLLLASKKESNRFLDQS